MPTLNDLAAIISTQRLHGHHGHIGELVLVIQCRECRDIEYLRYGSHLSGLIERGPCYTVEWMALGVLTGEDLIPAENGEFLVPVAYHALWTPRSIKPVDGPIRIDRLQQYGSIDDVVLEAAGIKVCHLCSIVAGNQEAVKAFQLEYDPYAVIPRKYSTIEVLYILATYAGAREILDSVLSEM